MNLGELDLTSEDFWLDEVDGIVHYIFICLLALISGLTGQKITIDMVHGCCLVSARFRLGYLDLKPVLRTAHHIIILLLYDPDF